MNRQQTFLLVLVAVSGLASLLILLPFLEYVLAAVLFAYVLYPLNCRIEPYLGRRFAPILVIVAGTVALALPLVFVGLVLYQDLQALAAGETGLELATVERSIATYTGEEVDLSQLAAEIGQALIDILFGNVTQLVTLGFTLLIGVTLVFFLVYYVLRDGPAFVRWAVRVAPLDVAVTRRLLDQVDRTTWGVVVGHIFVAVVQGVVGGLAFAVLGIPNYIFWTFAMVVLSLLPVVGAFLVWGPAVGYLWLVDDASGALFMLLWGLFVISLIDNYARPIVIDQSAHLNPGVILIGVVGGIYMIGFTGIFVGPIVLGIFAATLTAFHEDFDALAEHTPPPRWDDTDRLAWLRDEAERPVDEPDPPDSVAGRAEDASPEPGDATDPG